MTVKGIIEFGSHPSSSYIASSATWADVIASPVDGFCTHLTDNSGNNISQRLWGYSGAVTGYTESDVSTFISNVASRNAAGWGRVQYNFLVMQTPDKTTDWFSSDMELVIQNLKLLGRVVALTGLYGIVIEPEQYGTDVWRYNNMPLKATYTLAQYKTRIEAVGYEVGLYWAQQKADMALLLWKSYFFADTDSDYQMYGSFLDGIHRGFGVARDANIKYGYTSQKSPELQIISSNSQSYDDNDLTEFKRLHANQLIYQGNSGRYKDFCRRALTHWIDKNVHGDVSYPWNNSDPTNNYFNLSNCQSALTWMCQVPDLDFAVIYNENYHFFGSGTIINSQYLTSIRNAKKANGMVK